MKGMITKYIEEKGFGFILDENNQSRFFHIRNVKDKLKLINNLSDYYFSEYNDYDCLLVDFVPDNNDKGLTANHVFLTNEKFLDMTIEQQFPALVTEIEYDVQSIIRIVNGVKQGQNPISIYPITAGSNGTYRAGYPEVFRTLFLDFKRKDRIGWGNMDIREIALQVNDRSKVTPKFVQQLKDRLIGKEIIVEVDSKKMKLCNPEVLKV